ncbi:N-acetyltransferase [Conexibacter sp. JD483]|uniref:GNAT family N-acetyltransferase n=1 Tax=unclassified Conexibacter TaxID=2627773 RepID=UPI002728009D|nr:MULTISPECIES: N-acetyltransferase [unclassified Conexibacter]MDO8185730.1 N-acetyltransferase [Conexibacter sp. CPCC 205706]MDO8199107.1 N-acetyltransferase [Conexibacter sp. CPCC 205762]MDR9370961.1 N-acetyltransferase [Conexibacter sp. JD483]
MALTLRPERPEDLAGARRVHELAFPTHAEARLVDALRDERAHVPELCLVALRGDRVVGHVVFSRARLVPCGATSGADPARGAAAPGQVPLLVLAPIAVAPEAQRAGIGSALIREALRRAPAAAPGVPLISLLGDPAYYGRFGFERAAPLGLRAPFEVPDAAWQALRLPAYPPPDRPRPEGVVVYAQSFSKLT